MTPEESAISGDDSDADRRALEQYRRIDSDAVRVVRTVLTSQDVADESLLAIILVHALGVTKVRDWCPRHDTWTGPDCGVDCPSVSYYRLQGVEEQADGLPPGGR